MQYFFTKIYSTEYINLEILKLGKQIKDRLVNFKY